MTAFIISAERGDGIQCGLRIESSNAEDAMRVCRHLFPTFKRVKPGERFHCSDHPMGYEPEGCDLHRNEIITFADRKVEVER